MSLISPTLYSNECDGDINLPILMDGFCLYSYIFLCGEDSGYRAVPLLDKALEMLGKSSYGIHIRAKLLIEEGRYREGYEALHTLLFDDNGEFPEPMLYFVLGDIELCCKEIDDFKGAYDFSKSRIDLISSYVYDLFIRLNTIIINNTIITIPPIITKANLVI